jgi:hypothetical protein
VLIDAGRKKEGVNYLRDRIPRNSDYKGFANFLINRYQDKGKLGKDI